MRTVLSVATMLGMLGSAAYAVPYVLPPNQPGTSDPYSLNSAYSVEATYSIAEDSEDPDAWGARVRFNLYSDQVDTIRHQFSVNLGGMWGEKSDSIEGLDYKIESFMLPVTAGYDFNVPLCDSMQWYAGAKLGYVWTNVRALGMADESHGYTYSVGTGLRFDIAENIYMNVGYEYGKVFFKLMDNEVNYGHHTIVVGMGYQF